MENFTTRHEWVYVGDIYYTQTMDFESDSIESALLSYIPCRKDPQMHGETFTKNRSQNQLRYEQRPKFDTLLVENLSIDVLQKSGLPVNLITEVASVLKFERLRSNSATNKAMKYTSK